MSFPAVVLYKLYRAPSWSWSYGRFTAIYVISANHHYSC